MFWRWLALFGRRVYLTAKSLIEFEVITCHNRKSWTGLDSCRRRNNI